VELALIEKLMFFYVDLRGLRLLEEEGLFLLALLEPLFFLLCPCFGADFFFFLTSSKIGS
jgi:hypothetical protein